MLIRGVYYDGRTSVRIPVSVTRRDDGSLLISGVGVERSVEPGEARLDPPLGRSRRLLRFADGGVCELEDSLILRSFVRGSGRGRGWNMLHRWEMNLRRVLLALVVTAAVIFVFVRYGVPFLAKRAAFALPVAAEERLGSETLSVLDRMVLKPSTLPPARRQELRERFTRIASDGPRDRRYRLEFRSSPAIGANAFALPSGSVVLLDGLVSLAKSDDEIAAVLAHEIGHVRNRHAIRHLLQNSVTGLIVASVTGDIVSVTSLAAALPTMLIDARYSRDFEREADDAAVAYLKNSGIPVSVYADMLKRIDSEQRRKHGGDSRSKGPEVLLSTHPETEERIRRVIGK